MIERVFFLMIVIVKLACIVNFNKTTIRVRNQRRYTGFSIGKPIRRFKL